MEGSSTAGGAFTNIGGQPRFGIAAIDAATGSATSWNPSFGGGEVFALAVSGSIVYVGGDFTIIGGQSRYNIAALDTTTGLATSLNPDTDYEVYALAVSKRKPLCRWYIYNNRHMDTKS